MNLTKTEIYEQSLVKFCNLGSHKHPFGGSQVVIGGHTDMARRIGKFLVVNVIKVANVDRDQHPASAPDYNARLL
jgi:hypothetical protein